MTMVLCLPTLLNILFVCMLAAFVQSQTIKPHCLSNCGGVNIPYPFGVEEGCYRDEGFKILCNNTNNSITSTPVLGISKLEVVNISLNHQVKVKGFFTTDCYKSSNGQAQTTSFFDLRQSPFTLSYTKNKLFAIGCDIWAQIKDDKGQEYMAGCVSLCPRKYYSNESCSGAGCCQTIIPNGLKAFNLTITSINTETGSWVSNSSDHCSYAGLEDDRPMDFSLVNVSNIRSAIDNITHSKRILVLDWAVGGETCKRAKRSSKSYACRNNSKCVDPMNGSGYHCNCSNGYEGNPYIANGCQDIDECKVTNICPNGTICVNGEGSYHCKCPSGFMSDHNTNGFSCIPAHKNKHDHLIVVLIGIGVSVGLIVVLLVGYWLYKELKRSKRIQRKRKFFKRNGGLLLQQQISSSEGNIEKTKIFVEEELEKATDNFNESRILGRGGSGTVYKGMLSDGRIVAIKKSEVVDESQIGQFINELVILSHINHRNIVKLLGCCLETEVPLLAYEFISNGTLSHHLHAEDHKSSISWDNRLRIAIEIAGALAYLHSSVSIPIFHRDIKSTNILLDENYRAKVADFGISRSLPYEKTHLTTIVQGTFGYLDPEYLHSGQFTEKSDVYSFGVVLVELLTGRNPCLFTRPKEEGNLVMHFVSSVKENHVLQTLETRVLNEGGEEDLLAVAKLAKRCLKLVGKKRPTMKEVVTELEALRRIRVEHVILQSLGEAKDWMFDLSSASMASRENEGIEMTSQGGRKRKRKVNRRLRNSHSLPITRLHDVQHIHDTL